MHAFRGYQPYALPRHLLSLLFAWIGNWLHCARLTIGGSGFWARSLSEGLMPRKERGGAKTRRSKELAAKASLGEHQPQAAPTSETGVARVQQVEAKIVHQFTEPAHPKNPPSKRTERKYRPRSPSNSPPRGGSSSDVVTTVEPKAVPFAPSGLSKDKVAPSVAVGSSVDVPVVPVQEPPKKKLRLPGSRPKDTAEVKPREKVAETKLEPKAPVITPAAKASVSSLTEIPRELKPRPKVETANPVNPKSEKGPPPASANPTLGTSRVSPEIRISVDFNGVLNVSRAGDQEVQGFHPHNIEILRRFLAENSDRGFKIGITSYIGLSGRHSQERRAQLQGAVRNFNKNQDPAQKLGLRILSSREKGPFLRETGAICHIDDRLGILENCDQSLKTYWVSRGKSHRRRICKESLGKVLEHISESRVESS